MIGGVSIKNTIKIITFFSMVGLIIWMINTEWFSILKSGDLEEIALFFDEKWHVGLFITLILMLFQNMFTIIPLALIVTVNIFLYDFMWGFVWSWASSILGSILAFFLYRYWLHAFFNKKVNDQIKQKINNHSFLYVFFARLIPFVPSSLINTAAGASSIRFSFFVGATILGNMIFLFILSLLINELISSDMEMYIIVFFLGVAILIFYAFKWMKYKTKQKKAGSQ